jgi:hypothetical protein
MMPPPWLPDPLAWITLLPLGMPGAAGRPGGEMMPPGGMAVFGSNEFGDEPRAMLLGLLNWTMSSGTLLFSIARAASAPGGAEL